MLRSLYRAYIDSKGKFERLQGDYVRVRESYERLSNRLQKVKIENKTLRGVAANYERVKRAFGLEQAVEAAKQREQAEKARKRPRRSFSRDGR